MDALDTIEFHHHACDMFDNAWEEMNQADVKNLIDTLPKIMKCITQTRSVLPIKIRFLYQFCASKTKENPRNIEE